MLNKAFEDLVCKYIPLSCMIFLGFRLTIIHSSSTSRTSILLSFSEHLLLLIIWMLHRKSPLLSVLDLTLEYVKTMSFQYLVNRPATQIHSQSFQPKPYSVAVKSLQSQIQDCFFCRCIYFVLYCTWYSRQVIETIYAVVVIPILPLIVRLPVDTVLFTNTSYSVTSPFMFMNQVEFSFYFYRIYTSQQKCNLTL